MPETYLTAKQVADILQLDERTIKRYAERGEIPGYKVAGKWRFDPAEIEQYVRSQRPPEKKDQ